MCGARGIVGFSLVTKRNVVDAGAQRSPPSPALGIPKKAYSTTSTTVFDAVGGVAIMGLLHLERRFEIDRQPVRWTFAMAIKGSSAISETLCRTENLLGMYAVRRTDYPYRKM